MNAAGHLDSEHRDSAAFRVAMVDPRAWEEEGRLVLLGPEEDAQEWFRYIAAEGYRLEHITDDLAGAAPPPREGDPPYTDVIALAAPNPQLPLLYYLVTGPMWEEISKRLAAGPPACQ